MYKFLQRVNPAAAQDFSVSGRIAWAIYCHDAGKAAMEGGDLSTALATLREAIHAFPFPSSLEGLGECLLLKGRPVEAAIYLAAAIGMNEEQDYRQLFLLGKALAVANDNYVSKIMLEKALSIRPEAEAQRLLDEVISRSVPASKCA
jgi:tetratricopeptide (TPR) repeat protein